MTPHDDIAGLIQTAIDASKNAYVVYSGYAVGAALVAADGRVFTGCNVENAAYPAGVCAERTALVKAVSEGCREFVAVIVVTRGGGAPCGICRQALAEFAPDLRVVIADMDGRVHHDTTLRHLLPLSFGPADLEG
ncbi:MAG: cytidine deaminase [Anaerolineaceae bacterium]|nr:MAG: cytidine deaminase [Anaerolineaceae bacterium]